MTIHTAYHYMPESEWIALNNVSSGENANLHPGRKFIEHWDDRALPTWVRSPHLFAFLDEATPESWTENQEFPYIWDALMYHVRHGEPSVLIVKFELVPSDIAHIVDFAYLERARAEIERIKARNEQSGDMRKATEAFRMYVRSRISVGYYLRNYCLPELIIESQIPLERVIKVSTINQF